MKETDGTFDALQAEKNEVNILIEKGVKFHVPKRSILKYVSRKKDRIFTVNQPYLGVLDAICACFLAMELDEAKVMDDPLQESKKMTLRSAKLCAKVVAIAVLNSQWKIKLFSGIMTWYFMWHVQPKMLLELAYIINAMCNLPDFMNSIRLLSCARMTAPKVESLVEEKQED